MMGTNYYVTTEKCAACGHDPGPIHVGKSSGGWKFLFAGHESLGLTSKAAWCDFLRKHDGKITDEYNTHVCANDLIKLVEEKQEERLTGLNCWSLCGCSQYCRTASPSEFIDPEGYRIADGREFS